MFWPCQIDFPFYVKRQSKAYEAISKHLEKQNSELVTVRASLSRTKEHGMDGTVTINELIAIGHSGKCETLSALKQK